LAVKNFPKTENQHSKKKLAIFNLANWCFDPSTRRTNDSNDQGFYKLKRSLSFKNNNLGFINPWNKECEDGKEKENLKMRFSPLPRIPHSEWEKSFRVTCF